MSNGDCAFGKLPDHLLIEVFIRLPVREWSQISCVNKHWAGIFRGENFWQTAIVRTWPSASHKKRWPGPIPRGLARRRYAALYISDNLIGTDGETDELLGHAYLYLKEQLELSTMPPPASVLHGTIIDQFIACGRPTDKAHELASQIWLAVIDNLDENKNTFLLLKHLAEEEDITSTAGGGTLTLEFGVVSRLTNNPIFEQVTKNAVRGLWARRSKINLVGAHINVFTGEWTQKFFLPYPYSRSYKVLWRVFEKLFTDFRDCLNRTDYYDVLTCAKSKFQLIPSAWLGF